MEKREELLYMGSNELAIECYEHAIVLDVEKSQSRLGEGCGNHKVVHRKDSVSQSSLDP